MPFPPSRLDGLFQSSIDQILKTGLIVRSDLVKGLDLDHRGSRSRSRSTYRSRLSLRRFGFDLYIDLIDLDLCIYSIFSLKKGELQDSVVDCEEVTTLELAQRDKPIRKVHVDLDLGLPDLVGQLDIVPRLGLG